MKKKSPHPREIVRGREGARCRERFQEMTRDLLVGQLRLICATQRTIWPNPVAKGFQNASTLIVPLCVGISFEVGPEVSTVFKLHGRRRSSSTTTVRLSDVLRMRRAVPVLPEHNTRHLSATRLAPREPSGPRTHWKDISLEMEVWHACGYKGHKWVTWIKSKFIVMGLNW